MPQQVQRERTREDASLYVLLRGSRVVKTSQDRRQLEPKRINSSYDQLTHYLYKRD